jgi:hypothetical protein
MQPCRSFRPTARIHYPICRRRRTSVPVPPATSRSSGQRRDARGSRSRPAISLFGRSRTHRGPHQRDQRGNELLHVVHRELAEREPDNPENWAVASKRNRTRTSSNSTATASLTLGFLATRTRNGRRCCLTSAGYRSCSAERGLARCLGGTKGRYASITRKRKSKTACNSVHLSRKKPDRVLLFGGGVRHGAHVSEELEVGRDDMKIRPSVTGMYLMSDGCELHQGRGANDLPLGRNSLRWVL